MITTPAAAAAVSRCVHVTYLPTAGCRKIKTHMFISPLSDGRLCGEDCRAGPGVVLVRVT